MDLENLPPQLHLELSKLVETLQGMSLVESAMRIRALQELSEALGSEALLRLVATLIGA